MKTKRSDLIKADARELYFLVCRNIETYNSSVGVTVKFLGKKELELRILEKSIHQHLNHIDVHKVTQNSLDVYKMASWIGCAILDEARSGALEPDEYFMPIVKSIVLTLKSFYYADTNIQLPEPTIEFICGLLFNELKGNQNHGIWMNGLYLSFHVALESHKVQARLTA